MGVKIIYSALFLIFCGKDFLWTPRMFFDEEAMGLNIQIARGMTNA